VHCYSRNGTVSRAPGQASDSRIFLLCFFLLAFSS